MILPKKFEDSKLNTLTAKQGYYTVGDRCYHNKVNALIEATRTNQSVSWDFNHAVFSKQCAMPRMNVPLTTLYRERANQLRDTYDYLIIAFSGGADSDNVLKTFLYNDIKIDEIWVDWNHTMIDRSGYRLNLSKHAVNMPSEWYLSIKPELDKIRTSHPHIKIHISESLADTDNPEDKYDSLRINGLGHVAITKRNRFISEYVESISGDKSVAVVMGLDKVIPYARDNEYGILFTDGATLLKSSTFERGGCALEYFYWTPEFPQIVTEQAHLLWDYLFQSLAFTKERIKSWDNSLNWTDREKIFDDPIKKVCYPYWDFSKHQVNKAAFHKGDVYAYSRKYNNDVFFQGTESFLQSHFRLIDERFYDPNHTDVKELRSFFNFHKLGNLPMLNI